MVHDIILKENLERSKYPLQKFCAHSLQTKDNSNISLTVARLCSDYVIKKS